MIYLLDANTFIEGCRTYYPFDVAPGFWRFLTASNQSGQLASVQAVHIELEFPPVLKAWADSGGPGFWIPDTVESLAAAGEMVAWANDDERPYNDAARAEFADSADLRLAAMAAVSDGVVVTREVSAPEGRRRVKLPDVCEAFGVQCLQPFEVYRTLGLTLT
jgi:hypothetical protein